MKEQLIILAKEKGFISEIIGKSVDSKYSKKDFYYLWMCELQKWLRETYQINILICPSKLGYWWQIYDEKEEDSIDDTTDTYYKIYEKALEKVLLKILTEL